MRTHIDFTAGTRALFFGAVVIIDEHAKAGCDCVNVRWPNDPRRTTWSAKIEHLKPITSEESSHVHTIH